MRMNSIRESFRKLETLFPAPPIKHTLPRSMLVVAKPHRVGRCCDRPEIVGNLCWCSTLGWHQPETDGVLLIDSHKQDVFAIRRPVWLLIPVALVIRELL
ncbi:MAG: hypothetical protein GFH27_549281n196 [Chloroflexi bacterium AL-W]|nr:hypothetical protein [Chloroflexi bacterium AL-N1]NOK66082.1 hypothetical protein [Chloroflexi bacterium AL-N10]NOK72963.1 hypothetical protein [Chloroflexi bacterium AL-N5]NOK79860.1 hypothetical protein [Chloroflexi bacterium AL-W]NOK88284.1 hypothetical protein [Chloroflexi bacterium AL-N15]